MKFAWKHLAAVALLTTLTPVGVEAFGQEGKQEKPKVYDESADAEKDLAAALERAAKNHKRVLVVYGANWCGWCIKLDKFSKSNREVSRKLRYEYEVVKVDIGGWDKNMDMAARYQANIREGVPYLTVLDGAGKVVTNLCTGELETGPAHDEKKVMAFLEKHQATAPDAEDVMAAAYQNAKETGRSLYVHLGAPW